MSRGRRPWSHGQVGTGQDPAADQWNPSSGAQGDSVVGVRRFDRGFPDKDEDHHPGRPRMGEEIVAAESPGQTEGWSVPELFV